MSSIQFAQPQYGGLAPLSSSAIHQQPLGAGVPQPAQQAVMAVMEAMVALLKQMAAMQGGAAPMPGAQQGPGLGPAGVGGGAPLMMGMPKQASNPQAPLSTDQAKTLSVLGRHEGVFGKKGISFDKMAEKMNDPKTPPDLRQAIGDVLADPQLRARLDSAKNGRHDNKISAKDINKLQERPEVVEFSRQQAKTYASNYIPTDIGKTTQQGRPITDNDAQRELYKYSDNLPKNISRQTLQDIVDGKASMGKCPPQVVAAAQHYLDNPEQWKQIAGESGSISRGKLGDKMSRSIQLNAEEDKALTTMKNNEDAFFKGGSLSRDKLQKIAEDPKASADVRQAAKTLQDSPVLYGMLDNGKRGHGGDLWYIADDGKIGKGDLHSLLEHRNKTVAPSAPATQAPATAQDASAVNDMQAGAMDQPDIKSGKGGGFRKFLAGLAGGLSKVFEVFGQIVGKTLGKIPGFGKLLSIPAEIVANGISGGLNVAKTAAEGGDVKAAAKNMGLNLAQTAVEAPLGLIDPTGIGAGMAGQAFRSAIDPNTKFDPKKAVFG